ncbi:MAG: hypothetical protein ACQES9_07830 [Myxococcota bacterium]
MKKDKNKEDEKKPLVKMQYSAILKKVKKKLAKDYSGQKWFLYGKAVNLKYSSENKFRIMSFLTNQVEEGKTRSLLITTHLKIPKAGNPVFEIKELKGTIDELRLIKLGPDYSSHLVFVKRHLKNQGRFYIINSYYKPSGNKMKNVWQITSSYDTEYKETYQPPTFHYWDGNDDGVREVILTNPWYKEDNPPRWKYRWAVFEWQPQKKSFLPSRGLALNRYKNQDPIWLVSGVLEMSKLGKKKELLNFIDPSSSCMVGKDLSKVIFLKKWKKIKKPELVNKTDNSAKVSIDMQTEKQSYRMVFRLQANNQGITKTWYFCQVKLFKILEKEF